MLHQPLTAQEEALIEEVVTRYKGKLTRFEHFRETLHNTLAASSSLAGLIHSVRSRVKDPEHLRDKLRRKIREANAPDQAFDVTVENFFQKVNDLVGVRLLHLHTAQIAKINRELLAQLAEYEYRLIEGPVAHIWDRDYEQFFRRLSIKTVDNPRMYTSVHYVVEQNSRTRRTAEIQVRTLADELWGEVDHTLNYPHQSSIAACRDQIKVLARFTSGCSRLVDSIFDTSDGSRGDRDEEGRAA